jgi:hypothetical protein
MLTQLRKTALSKLANPSRAFSTFEPPEHKLFMNMKPMRRQHPIYSRQGIEEIEQTHRTPENFKEKIAK